jgi:putative ABC transport system permease protein
MMRASRWLGELRDDVKFAVRQLTGAPGFTAVAAITLALGIGANSALFALVDATLLRPLPFRQADQLVMVWETTSTSNRGAVSPLNLQDWAQRSQTIEVIGGVIPGFTGGMVMAGADGFAETVPRQWVTARIFEVLGVQPVLGRTFVASDEKSPNVVLLSEGLWRSRFGSDPGVIGRDVRFDGDPFTVVGVVPGDFQLLGPKGIWAIRPTGSNPALRAQHFLRAVARLKPGITIEAAQADLAAVAEGLAREFPQTNKDRSVVLEPMRDGVIGGELRLTALLFLGVVGFLLLMCCANMANLLLARGTGRSREIAVRAALGADRGRIVRQLLTESLVLAGLGGVLGLLVGAGILNVAPALIPRGLLAGTLTLEFNERVAGFCAVAAVVVGLVFGVAPALQATKVSLMQAIGADGRSVTRRGGAARGVLVGAQVAIAVVLLFGAGLLLRTLIAVERVDRGYQAEQILTMMVDPLGSRYRTYEALQQFFSAIEQEVTAIPGVRSVAWASTLPLGVSTFGRFPFEIVGDPPVEPERRPEADLQIVSRSYFETVDLPIVRGRPFTDQDSREAAPVCIVNEAFVRGPLQGRNPIGMRIASRSILNGRPIVREIVGVARQVKGRPDEAADLVQVYVPSAQNLIDDAYLVVRPASGRADTLAAPVRAAIARVDRDQLVSVRDVLTLEAVASEATSRHRFRAVMVATFAGLALLLAMVGVFGLLAYSVQQRAREFGVRMALGASIADVLRLVVGGMMRLIVPGAVGGLLAAAALSRSISVLLFGVQPLDPLTFLWVAAVLAITVVIAMVAPAWRAAHVDPAVTLRTE